LADAHGSGATEDVVDIEDGLEAERSMEIGAESGVDALEFGEG
jgi:hypothetical protein